MLTIDKQLEILRQEQQQLSIAVSRVALVAFALLFLFVTAFSRAYQQIDAEEVRSQVAEARRLGEISNESLSLSYIYLLFPEASASKPLNSSHYSQQETQEALAKKLQLEKLLETQAKSWFNVRITAIGSGIEIDLRYWIFFLPLLFWASMVRLHILRKKEYALREVYSFLFQSSDIKDLTHFDQLLVDRSSGLSTEYARQPMRAERVIYISCVVGIIIYLFANGWHFWGLWGLPNLCKIAGILIGITFYFWAFCQTITRRLDSQLQSLIGFDARAYWTDKLQDRLKRFAEKAFAPLHLRSRLSISTGASMVLLTLLLGMAQSCDSGQLRYKGYQFFDPKTSFDAVWLSFGYSDIGLIQLNFPSFTPLGIIFYSCSLGLAAISLLLAALPSRRLTLLRRTVRGAQITSVLIVLFLMADISIGYWFCPPLARAPVDIIEKTLALPGVIFADASRIIFCVLPFIIWLRLTSPKVAWSPGLLKARSLMRIAFVPALFSACIALPLLAYDGLPGVPMLFFGIGLLAIGYSGAVAKAQLHDQLRVPIDEDMSHSSSGQHSPLS